jgi:uncharacterized protein (TIRG00374 family)
MQETERERPARNIRSRVMLWLALPLAAGFLYFTLRDLDWASFWDTIRHGRYEFLLLAVPIASVSYFIRAVRWSVLVRSEGEVSILSVFWANMVGYMGNAYLPARAGELLRAGFLGRQKGLGTSFVLATALSERILDVVALVLIGSMALLLGGLPFAALKSAVSLMAAAGLLALAVVLLAPFQEVLLLRIVGRLPLREQVTNRIAEQVSRFLVGMRALQNMRRLLVFVGLTVVVWLTDAVGVLIGVRIISQHLLLGQALVLLAALGLSSAIPSTPGYVGVYQFVAVTVLMPYGFSRGGALAYILISQVFSYLVVTFWGLLGLWQIGRGGEASSPGEAS